MVRSTIFAAFYFGMSITATASEASDEAAKLHYAETLLSACTVNVFPNSIVGDETGRVVDEWGRFEKVHGIKHHALVMEAQGITDENGFQAYGRALFRAISSSLKQDPQAEAICKSTARKFGLSFAGDEVFDRNVSVERLRALVDQYWRLNSIYLQCEKYLGDRDAMAFRELQASSERRELYAMGDTAFNILQSKIGSEEFAGFVTTAMEARSDRISNLISDTSVAQSDIQKACKEELGLN